MRKALKAERFRLRLARANGLQLAFEPGFLLAFDQGILRPFERQRFFEARERQSIQSAYSPTRSAIDRAFFSAIIGQ